MQVSWEFLSAVLYNFVNVFCVLKLTYTSTSHRRGLNPPHRVKSISMTTFTAQEIEFLQKHSNEVEFQLYNISDLSLQRLFTCNFTGILLPTPP